MMNQKIDFLGIGAQKAATSWLYQNLRHHPDIWMPFRKELHYFDRSPIYPPDYYKLTWIIKRFLRSVSEGDWNQARWILRYFLGTYSDDWYRSLFALGEGKVKGEITPSYSILNLEDVKHVKEMFPELKVILILRNPIERAWSHVRFEAKRQGLNGADKLEKVKKFIDAPDQTLRSDYLRILDIWSSCFPKEQIFLGFYDDIMKDPQGVVLRIFKFLGVALLSNSEVLSWKVNVSREWEMPREIQEYLASRYCSELQRLSDLLGGPCTLWLKQSQAILNAARECAGSEQMMPAGAAPGN